MPTPATQLATAYLAIDTLLALPTLYILFRHGKHGLLGWGYLLLYFVLRMTGAGLQISNPASSTGQTINGVGLSPLLLAVLGVMHESNHYIPTSSSSSQQDKKSWLLKWPAYIIMHVLIGTAVGLVVAGNTSSSSSSSSSSTNNPSNSGLARVGTIVFLIVWILLAGTCALSYRYPKSRRDAQILLHATTLALPPLLVRILYTIASSFDSNINAYTGPIVYRVVLEALMEWAVGIELVVLGVVTRNICREKISRSRKEGVPLEAAPRFVNFEGRK